MPAEWFLRGMLVVFVVSFLWSWVATSEVYEIARGNPAKGALWNSANSSLNFILTFIIAATLTIAFIFPYVLGTTLATYLVLYRKAHR
jgi:hypothetical protein